MDKRPWWQWIDDKLAISAFWDMHGLMLSARAASLFSLPIEGGFWSSVMGQGIAPQVAAYALPFTLDLIADLVVYRYGRIQQSTAKGTKKWKMSRFILVFAFFNGFASWGTAAWQLNNAGQWGEWKYALAFPILFALIQPAMGAAVAYTQAVQDGKYDEEPTAKPEPKRIKGQPKHDWWLTKLDSLNGDREQITPERVREMCLAEYTDAPSATTLYNWSKEVKGG